VPRCRRAHRAGQGHQAVLDRRTPRREAWLTRAVLIFVKRRRAQGAGHPRQDGAAGHGLRRRGHLREIGTPGRGGRHPGPVDVGDQRSSRSTGFAVMEFTATRPDELSRHSHRPLPPPRRRGVPPGSARRATRERRCVRAYMQVAQMQQEMSLRTRSRCWETAAPAPGRESVAGVVSSRTSKGERDRMRAEAPRAGLRSHRPLRYRFGFPLGEPGSEPLTDAGEPLLP